MQLRVFDIETLESLAVVRTPPNCGAICGLAVGADGTVYIGGQDTCIQVCTPGLRAQDTRVHVRAPGFRA